MQIRIFTIPVPGGEALSEEMNQFLRAKKILQIERQFVSNDQGVFWCFCISYMDDLEKSDRNRKKVDYRQLLDEPGFKRFSQMRQIRKKLAQEEAIPAYAIFSDEEMAELARAEPLTEEFMKSIKGIGEKKTEKYGPHFLHIQADEKSQTSD